MHSISIALFAGIMVLCLVLFIQLVVHGYIQTSDLPGVKLSFSQLYWPANGDSVLFVKAINLFVMAMAFTSNLFPVYTDLKHKSDDECIKAVSWAVLVAASVYTWVGWTTLLLFGDPTASHINFMNNVNEEYHWNPTIWDSFVIRIAYIVIILCHIPFFFFHGKEALLIIVDEIDRKSCSQALEERMIILKQNDLESTMQKSDVIEKSPNQNYSQKRTLSYEGPKTKVFQKMGQKLSQTPTNFLGKLKFTSEVRDLRLATAEPQKLDTKLGYKEMKDSYYYLTSFLLIFFILLTAILLPNVEIMFDILSLFCSNFICFFFPASFYLFAVRKV